MAEGGDPPRMRWWGWGDPAHTGGLGPRALSFLADTVGIADRPRPPVALEHVRLKEPALGAALEALRELAPRAGVRDDHVARVQHAAGRGYPDLVRLRESLKEPFAERGAKLTYLAFFVKAVVAALKDVPIVNASLDSESEEIVLHDRYNIGIAVASPSGLIVPVIHEADKKELIAIVRDIERLTGETRAGKVRVEDLRGGTFTITSVGGIGGLISTPVINHPEVAILGIGKVVKRPVFDAAGNVRPADMIYLSLSFDHRVVDGAIGAAFCNAIMRRLQNPATMLLPDLETGSS